MKIENINEVEDCLEHLKKTKRAKELIKYQDANVVIVTNCANNIFLNTVIDEDYLKSIIKTMLEKKEDEITKRLKKL